jgi:hypothetical protein
MKIDYDKIKEFLQIFEDSKEPTINTLKIFEKLKYSDKNDEDSKQVWFYLKLLNDQGLLECLNQDSDKKETLGFSYFGNGQIHMIILNFRLTMQGYQTLESMTNQNIWNKLKVPLTQIGIEGLKQIPSLAIKIFETYMK